MKAGSWQCGNINSVSGYVSINMLYRDENVLNERHGGVAAITFVCLTPALRCEKRSMASTYVCEKSAKIIISSSSNNNILYQRSTWRKRSTSII